MKRMMTALLTTAALCLALAAPAGALTPEDFSGGALSGIVRDGEALLVTDTYNKVVWRVEGEAVSLAAGQISVPGLNGEPVGGYADGTLGTALFLEPWAIAPFLDGWAVTDAQANVIRYIDSSGVRTAAGSGKAGLVNGTGSRAVFDRPTGLAAAPDGSLYIADTGNGAIRRLDPEGNVTTVLTGLADPTGLCWADGALYAAETGRSRILRIVDGRMEVLAGESTALGDGEYEGGYVDGPVDAARFDHPQGVAVGTDGAVYISDTGNHAVRCLAGGRVTTLARAGQTSLPPVQPRGILAEETGLTVADPFAQSLFTLELAPVQYSDVASEMWFAGAVREATQRGLVSGTGGGCFSPDAPVTRASLVVMLARLHQSTDGGAVLDGSSSFSDVPADTWYSSAVRWAADQQIVLGDNGSFRPSDPITREALATLLYRYAAFLGFDTSARADLSGYSDGSAVSSYAADALSWAVAEGVLNGTGANALAPRTTASRAQAAQMLLNFMDSMGI